MDKADGGGLRALIRVSKGDVVTCTGGMPRGVLTKEFRLPALWGTLKLGVDCWAGAKGRTASGCPGFEYVDNGRDPATRMSKTWLIVCNDCLRSIMAIALGRNRGCDCSSRCGRSGMESNSPNESRIGEHAGDEPTDVTMVRWPDEMKDRRLALSLRASSCLPSWEIKLAVELSSKDWSRARSGST